MNRIVVLLLSVVASVVGGLLFVQLPLPGGNESTASASAVAAAQSVALPAVQIVESSSTQFASVPAVQAESPIVELINTGGPTLISGKLTWNQDRYYDGGRKFSSEVDVKGSESAALYQTERNGSTFAYRIPVPRPGVYLVQLHFAEIYWSQPGERVFNVTIEHGAGRLTNYDIVAEVGPHQVVVKDFQVPVDDGTLDIEFSSVTDRAKVSAVTVLATDIPLPAEPAAAEVPTYWLAPDGATEYCGTQATPCQAPQQLPRLPAGALVLAAAGDYPAWIVDGLQGTVDRPIIIQSASGGRDIGLAHQLRITNSASVVVDGISLNSAGVWIENAEYVTLRNSRILNAPEDAIRYHLALYTHINNVEIRDSIGSCIAAHVREVDRQNGDPYVGSDLKRYGFGTVIENSALINCGAQGIFLTTMSPTIRNNLISHIGQHDQDPRVHGIYSKSTNALIENNLIEDTVHNGISIRNTALVRGNTVRDVGREAGPAELYGGACYSYYNDGPRSGGLVVFENNLCYRPGPHFNTAFRIDGTTSEGSGYQFVIRNNTASIAADPAIELVSTTNATFFVQHNILVRQDVGELVIGTGSVAMGNNLLRDNAGDAADIFIDPGNGNFDLVKPLTTPATLFAVDWRPDAQSPMLDDLTSAAPTDLRGRARGSEPGLGALEHQ